MATIEVTVNPGTDGARVMRSTTLEIAKLEELAVRAALLETNGNMKKSAQVLGISRSACYSKARLYGLLGTNEGGYYSKLVGRVGRGDEAELCPACWVENPAVSPAPTHAPWCSKSESAVSPSATAP